MVLLVAAVALSLAAQLAVAKPGVSGWLLSAVPALAFMGLSKLVLSGPAPQTSAGTDASSPASAGDRQRPGPSPVPAGLVPEVDPGGPGTVPAHIDGYAASGPQDGDQDDQTGNRDEDGQAAVSADLLGQARMLTAEHRRTTGRDITRDQLRVGLRVSNQTAGELLRLLRQTDRPSLVPVPAGTFVNTNQSAVHSQLPTGGGE